MEALKQNWLIAAVTTFLSLYAISTSIIFATMPQTATLINEAERQNNLMEAFSIEVKHNLKQSALVSAQYDANKKIELPPTYLYVVYQEMIKAGYLYMYSSESSEKIALSYAAMSEFDTMLETARYNNAVGDESTNTALYQLSQTSVKELGAAFAGGPSVDTSIFEEAKKSISITESATTTSQHTLVAILISLILYGIDKYRHIIFKSISSIQGRVSKNKNSK